MTLNLRHERSLNLTRLELLIIICTIIAMGLHLFHTFFTKLIIIFTEIVIVIFANCHMSEIIVVIIVTQVTHHKDYC